MSELDSRIPNNVALSQDPRLQRALLRWQPAFLNWWSEMGPEGFQGDDVFLRTAISVEPSGWSHFDYVRMPDYRWGIFLAPPEQDRRIGFGDLAGQPVWQEVPGEFRTDLRRLIVTQGDTEPASVEQQRQLGRTAPSLYDLRNLFQVNVEEGRHLWAMVYLLHSHFGRDGREEADALLERHSGDADRPRILQAFNEPCDDWLNFYLFTMFTDRDGKYQLLALAESAFDPLSRTTRFMLTEEAFHMSVGETGVGRIVERTAEVMASGEDDPRGAGVFDLPLIQRHINFWFSASLDLFGGEVSSNAAHYFANGLKGRARESRRQDHAALDGVYLMELPEDGALRERDVPLRNAMNEILRDDYVRDCERGLGRWNRILEDAGLPERLTLPSRRFHRQIGAYSGHRFDPEGLLIDEGIWRRKSAEWLPTADDREYVRHLMVPVYEPGKMASWIAPPKSGVDGKPIGYEYVKRP
ncbi:MAG: benzoyl-CoA 2,3-epoxidase subunit BoxB [Acidobacteria bacterium]|nr:benzoyl-CoA 2,3-epoxidase subunit BoxB [Acidobacteriota bacterium]